MTDPVEPLSTERLTQIKRWVDEAKHGWLSVSTDLAEAVPDLLAALEDAQAEELVLRNALLRYQDHTSRQEKARDAQIDRLREQRDTLQSRIDAAFALCDESTAQWGSDGHVVIKDTRVVRVVYETDLRAALTGED